MRFCVCVDVRVASTITEIMLFDAVFCVCCLPRLCRFYVFICVVYRDYADSAYVFKFVSLVEFMPFFVCVCFCRDYADSVHVFMCVVYRDHAVLFLCLCVLIVSRNYANSVSVFLCVLYWDHAILPVYVQIVCRNLWERQEASRLFCRRYADHCRRHIVEIMLTTTTKPTSCTKFRLDSIFCFFLLLLLFFFMTVFLVFGLTEQKRLLFLDYTLVTLILLIPFYWRDRSHLCLSLVMSYWPLNIMRLLSCSDFIGTRERYFAARPLGILFEDVLLEYIFDYLKEIKIFWWLLFCDQFFVLFLFDPIFIS